MILFSVLMIALNVLSLISKLFEKFLSYTILLGIPSKILGAVLGVAEAFIYVFASLYILKLPIFEQKYISESKLADKILNSTPVLTRICDKTLTTFNDVVELKNEYPVIEDKTEFNQKILDLLIKDKIITKENAKLLIEQGKLKDMVVN